MKKLIFLSILFCLMFSCGQKQTVLTEESLIGSWECISGCDAEFYVFSKTETGYEYYTYSGQRMYENGEYRINENQLILYYMGEDSGVFNIEIKKDSLLLNNGNIKFKYYKEKKKEASHTDELFGELDDLLKVFPDFDFGDQEPVDFLYNSRTYEDQYETVTISGISVKTTVKLAGDFINASDVINRITQVITEQGFTIDELNVTESCSTYTDNSKMVVQICTAESNGDELPDELNIIINFGFLD